MSEQVKKTVLFQMYHYKNVETKLEKMAARGLLLQQCAPYLWTFKKGEPRQLKYTITYFSEGSLFNPHITENQETYFSYAKASGWEFVTGLNQMQIFCSEAENPVPFETDEREKFENVKQCMKKSFLPLTIVLVLIFLFNFFLLFNSFKTNPIDFLSDANSLLFAMMSFFIILCLVYSLLNYWVWCKRGEKSLAMGEGYIERPSRAQQIIDIAFLCCIFGSSGWLLLHTIFQGNWFALLIGMVQMPMFIFVYWTSIKYFKKKKLSAMANKIFSCSILVVVGLAYLALIMILVSRFDFHVAGKADYSTVTWPVTPTISHDYKLYRDEIPLTCEDLYGPLQYDYYSYEETISSTIFLTRSRYWQDSLPAKNAPAQLRYDILEPHLDFVYQLAKEQLLEIAEQQQPWILKPIDNQIFGTIEAYQRYYDGDATGNYSLFFEDKIILLNLENPATWQQIAVIKEKLQF